MSAFAALFLLLSLAAAPASTESSPASSLPLNRILDRMEQLDGARRADLSSYTCLRHYRLQNRRFHVSAELTARLTYHAPGQKTFEVLSGKGPAVIRKKVLERMIQAEEESSQDRLRPWTLINRSNYSFTLLGRQALDGRPAYLLDATPSRRNRFLIRGRVWVDAADFAVVRVEVQPAENPSVLIRDTHAIQQYERVDGFWLPQFNHANSDSLLFGRTEVVIDSSDYRIDARNPPLRSQATAGPLPDAR